MIAKLIQHTPVPLTARFAHLASEPLNASRFRVSDSIGEPITRPDSGVTQHPLHAPEQDTGP